MEQDQNPYRIESSSRADAEAALREAQNWLSPLPWDRLVKLLGELYLKTARRSEEDFDRDALFSLYGRALSAYPGDVVRDAINGYRGKFFPALVELQDEISTDRRIRERRLRIEALRAFLNGDQGEKPIKRCTPEQLEQIKKKYGWEGSEVYAPPSEEVAENLARVDALNARPQHTGEKA